ncbi:MAG: hypothetical protein AAFP69_20560, partial [Planctomycetota bacterium]
DDPGGMQFVQPQAFMAGLQTQPKPLPMTERLLRNAAPRVGLLLVIALGFWLRLQSSHESLWLDELHSSWVVADDAADVAWRCRLGNQSPVWFYGLWVWQSCLQFAGDGYATNEVCLRGISSLAAAMMLLVVGCMGYPASTQATGSPAHNMIWGNITWGSITAAFLLALDSNAIFFGSELRPFSFAMLFVALALYALQRDRRMMLAAAIRHPDSDSDSGKYRSPGFANIVLFASVAACLMHVTAALFAGPLLFLSFANRFLIYHRDCKRISMGDCLRLSCALIIAAGATAWLLPPLWNAKANWNSFAGQVETSQLLELFPWTILLLAPLAMEAISLAIHRFRGQPYALGNALQRCLLPVAVVLATSIVYVAARQEWLPLFHRRYLICGLPVLAVFAGQAMDVFLHVLSGRSSDASSSDSMAITAPFTSRSALGIGVIGIGLMGAACMGLLYQQGTTHQILDQKPLAIRNDGWREAIQALNQFRDKGEPVYLFTGLIELNDPDYLVSPQDYSTASPAGKSDLARRYEYLQYPLRGQYRVEVPTAVQTLEAVSGSPAPVPGTGLYLWRDLPWTSDPKSRAWAILRVPPEPQQPAGKRFGNLLLTELTGR